MGTILHVVDVGAAVVAATAAAEEQMGVVDITADEAWTSVVVGWSIFGGFVPCNGFFEASYRLVLLLGQDAHWLSAPCWETAS